MLSELRKAQPNNCLSDLMLDEWHAGELDSAAARIVEEHVASCDRCRARQQALQAVANEFLRARPGAPQRRFRARTVGIALSGLAVAAAALLLMRTPEPFGERSKGGPSLGFFVLRGERVFAGSEGERLQPGDRLRFVATSLTPRQLAILSRDARGVASVYYPAAPHSRLVAATRETPLDTAVELDGTLGTETLFGVFCDQEFEVEPLRQALERSGKLPSLPGCSVDQLEVRKEAR